jgi:O-succinylbenzoate synthase
VKLEGLELVRVAIPFRAAIGTAAGAHRVRPLLFVRVVTDEAEGWGECAALDEGTAVDPPLDAVHDVAMTRGVARLRAASAARDGQVPDGGDIAALFAMAPADRMVAAALEMAVADADLRRQGRSLAETLELAIDAPRMRVGAVVGIPEGRDLGALRAEVDAAVAAGAGRVRLKIAPGWDHEPVRTVRADHPDLVLQADANGAYAMEDAPVVAGLAQFDLTCVEQPLPAADLVALAAFAERCAVPVCLDESLSTPRRVLDALRNGACQFACLKPGRLGGWRATRQAHAACVAAGVPAFIGGFFEAGLGRTANLVLSARLAQDAPGLVSDVSDPADYLAVDPCGYPPVHDGWVEVPSRPGVGPAPDAAVLAGLPVQRRWFPASDGAT